MAALREWSGRCARFRFIPWRTTSPISLKLCSAAGLSKSKIPSGCSECPHCRNSGCGMHEQQERRINAYKQSPNVDKEDNVKSKYARRRRDTVYNLRNPWGSTKRKNDEEDNYGGKNFLSKAFKIKTKCLSFFCDLRSMHMISELCQIKKSCPTSIKLSNTTVIYLEKI